MLPGEENGDFTQQCALFAADSDPVLGDDIITFAYYFYYYYYYYRHGGLVVKASAS